MMRSRKFLVLCSILSFMLGFLFVYPGETIHESGPPIDEVNLPPKRVLFSRVLSSPVTPDSAIMGSVRYDYTAFTERLKGKMSPEEYEELFAEVLSINDIAPFNARMTLLLKHWGEASPRHALEKIRDYQGAQYWVNMVFTSWARKNPEEAASYYAESEDRSIKNNDYALSAIAYQWAIHDPNQAWEWLNGQRGKGMFTEKFQNCKDALIVAIAMTHSEKIPDFLEKWDEEDQKNNAYILARHWPETAGGLNEWIEKLPREAIPKALAGKILAQTDSDFKKIVTEVSHYDVDMQGALASELTSEIMKYGGNDIPERVEWLLETMPEKSYQSSWFQMYVNNWFEEDNKRARQWITSLPTEKKEKMIHLINSAPGRLRYE